MQLRVVKYPRKMRKATKSPFCSNSLCETSLLLLTDKVRIPARLRILPETGLKVLHDIVRVPQRVAPVQLATPPLLRGARLVRHQRDRLGDARLLSDGDVLGVDLGFARAVPVAMSVLLSYDGGRSLNRGGARSIIDWLRLLDVLSLVSCVSNALIFCSVLVR